MAGGIAGTNLWFVPRAALISNIPTMSGDASADCGPSAVETGPGGRETPTLGVEIGFRRYFC